MSGGGKANAQYRLIAKVVRLDQKGLVGGSIEERAAPQMTLTCVNGRESLQSVLASTVASALSRSSPTSCRLLQALSIHFTIRF